MQIYGVNSSSFKIRKVYKVWWDLRALLRSLLYLTNVSPLVCSCNYDYREETLLGYQGAVTFKHATLHFFARFRFPPVPTNCPWVSEDGKKPTQRNNWVVQDLLVPDIDDLSGHPVYSRATEPESTRFRKHMFHMIYRWPKFYVRRSAFCVRRCAFGVRRSAFGFLHSAFGKLPCCHS